ncbi:MAG: xylulokinase [Deinococcus sp.]|nr:xylulokinase [Deinococcus sp.]
MDLVGLDIGTTGVKGLRVNQRGKVVASASSSYPLSAPRPLWAEQDPEDWWRATVEVLRQLGAGEVAGLALSGQMHGLVPLDARLRVVRPAILWCDQRTARECQEITNTIGEERLLQLAANPALAGFTAPKVVWMRNNEPELYRKIRHVLLPKDYVRYRLTGELAIDASDAAGTLLFNVQLRKWSEEILEALDIDQSWLPPVLESPQIAGKITTAVAQATGLPEGMTVAAGGADNPCAAVGIGVVRRGLVSSSIGTSGTLLAHTDQPLIDPQGRVHTFCHSVPGCWYCMGVMLSAGNSLRWYRDTFAGAEREVAVNTGRDVYDLLAQEAEQAPPGCEGLVFLPYLMGERTPHKDSYARGVWFGLTGRHSRPHLVRSVLEGVALGLRDSLEILHGMGLEVREIRVIGGGARSRLWCQIQSDVFNQELAVPQVDEGPAFGAALLAGVAVGQYATVEEACSAAVRIKERVQPNSKRVKLYNQVYDLYRSLYPRLADRFKVAAQFPLADAPPVRHR